MFPILPYGHKSFKVGDKVKATKSFDVTSHGSLFINVGTKGSIVREDSITDMYVIELDYPKYSFAQTNSSMQENWEIIRKIETVPITPALANWYKQVSPYVGKREND